jgi:uncharacterized protein (TIGR00255 family)
MTGFGRAEIAENGISVCVEIRSVNHRYLDLDIRAPKNLFSFEGKIREILSTHLSRGRVTVSISVKGEAAGESSFSVDRRLAKDYWAALTQLQEELGLAEKLTVEHLLTFPDIVSSGSGGEVTEEVLRLVERMLTEAIEDLSDLRRKEGDQIKNDLVYRIGLIENLLGQIERRAPERTSEVRDKLIAKVATLAEGVTVDEGRLEMEIAFLAEKMDVTEECIRFKSHNALFLELLEKERSEGRKLNFLLQEMHREANTIGAKASDAGIAHAVVEIKEEVEKLREQIQNIE